MPRFFRTHFVHFAQGLLMGGADIIPGVSGGTMALIVGIYERLVGALSEVFSAVLALLRLNMTEVRSRLRRVEWGLILPLGLGILTAIVIGAKVIPPLLEAYPVHCRGLFFGLIAASLLIPWRRIARPRISAYLLAGVAAGVAFFLVGLPDQVVEDPGALRIFATAAVAICAMILPGVSGAFLLLVLGMYAPTLEAVNARDVGYVLIFMAGAATGLGLFSKALDWLLSHHHDHTMAALVGLMLGSLRALWPWLAEDRSMLWPGPADPVLGVILLGVAGFLFVLALTLWGRRSLNAGTVER